jgi:hypothetical protein
MSRRATSRSPRPTDNPVLAERNELSLDERQALLRAAKALRQRARSIDRVAEEYTDHAKLRRAAQKDREAAALIGRVIRRAPVKDQQDQQDR